VYVNRRPNLRTDQIFNDLGKAALIALFDTQAVKEGVTSLYFAYPERWANILEQRALVEGLADKSIFPDLKDVTILTHSVYIIQTCPSKLVRVLDDPSPDDYKEQGYIKGARYSPRKDYTEQTLVPLYGVHRA